MIGSLMITFWITETDVTLTSLLVTEAQAARCSVPHRQRQMCPLSWLLRTRQLHHKHFKNDRSVESTSRLVQLLGSPSLALRQV